MAIVPIDEAMRIARSGVLRKRAVAVALAPLVISGKACPACGRKVPMTGAERQRKWRARKLLASVHAKMSNVTLGDADTALNMDAVFHD